MLPSLVPIAAKKPAGRQSNNINKSSSSSLSLPSINNNSTLIVLATIASQVYNIKLDPTNRKSTKDIITSLKTQYTINKNLFKRIEEVVDDIDNNLPDYKKIRDSDSNIDGTLHVCRYVHRKLNLVYKSYTKFEVRLLMMNILKKVERKEEGSKNLGISPQSISNYFKEIGLKLLLFEESEVNIRSLVNIYNELDEEDDDDSEMKILMEESIINYTFPVNGTPPVHLHSITDTLVVREGQKATLGYGVDKKKFSINTLQISKHMAEQMELLANDNNNDLTDLERAIYLKKAQQLFAFKASMSTCRRYHEQCQERMDLHTVYKKSAVISAIRAKKANPLLQETFTRNVLTHWSKLYAEGKMQTPRPLPQQIHNWDEQGIDANGKINRVLTIIYELAILELEGGSGRTNTIVASEHAPFHNSFFWGNNAEGDLIIQPKPYIIKQSSMVETISGSLLVGLDQEGENFNVTSNPAGYNDQTIYDHFANNFVVATHASETNPQFLFEDSHNSHMNGETMEKMLENNVHRHFFVSNNSTDDQPQDMGPNSSFAKYIDEEKQLWQARYPGLNINQSYYNTIIAKAWERYKKDPRRVEITKKAFRLANLYPMITFWNDDYSDISDSLKRSPDMLKKLKDRVNISMIYVIDDESKRRLKLISNFHYSNNPTTNNIRPNNERIRIVNGYPMDQAYYGTGVESGTSYTIMTNTIASNALEKSFIAPAHELRNMIESFKNSSTVAIPLQGVIEGSNNLSNPFTGAIGTFEAIDKLKKAQEAIKASKEDKKRRKEDKLEKSYTQKTQLKKLKISTINYFKNHTEIERKSYVNKMLKANVDVHTKAFGGILTESKKMIKIGPLKERLLVMITEACDNDMDEDEGGNNMDEDDDSDSDEDGDRPEVTSDDDEDDNNNGTISPQRQRVRRNSNRHDDDNDNYRE